MRGCAGFVCLLGLVGGVRLLSDRLCPLAFFAVLSFWALLLRGLACFLLARRLDDLGFFTLAAAAGCMLEVPGCPSWYGATLLRGGPLRAVARGLVPPWAFNLLVPPLAVIARCSGPVPMLVLRADRAAA